MRGGYNRNQCTDGVRGGDGRPEHRPFAIRQEKSTSTLRDGKTCRTAECGAAETIVASSTHYINIKLNEQTHQASNLQGIFKVQTFGQAQCESPLAAVLAHSAEQVRCESPLVTAIHCRLSKPRARCPSPLLRSKGRVRPMRVVNRSSHPPAAEHARCELPLNAVVVKPLSTLKARRHLLLPTIHGWTPRCE